MTLSSRLQCDFPLKKFVRTLRLRQVVQLFFFTNASRNRVDFTSAMLIEHRPFLTPYRKSLIIFSCILIANIYLKSDAELQIYLKNGKWIHFSVVVYLDNHHANTCRFAKISSNDIVLHELEWHHRTRKVSGLRRSSHAFISPGGGEGGRVRQHVGYWSNCFWTHPRDGMYTVCCYTHDFHNFVGLISWPSSGAKWFKYGPCANKVYQKGHFSVANWSIT